MFELFLNSKQWQNKLNKTKQSKKNKKSKAYLALTCPAQPAQLLPLAQPTAASLPCRLPPLPGGRARARRARPRAPATSSLLRPPPASLLASTTPWRRHAAPTTSLTLPYLSLRPYPPLLSLSRDRPRAPERTDELHRGQCPPLASAMLPEEPPRLPLRLHQLT